MYISTDTYTYIHTYVRTRVCLQNNKSIILTCIRSYIVIYTHVYPGVHTVIHAQTLKHPHTRAHTQMETDNDICTKKSKDLCVRMGS